MLQGCPARCGKHSFLTEDTPTPGQEAPQRKAANDLFNYSNENFFVRNSLDRADNVRTPLALVLIVDGKQSYQLFCFQVNSYG